MKVFKIRYLKSIIHTHTDDFLNKLKYVKTLNNFLCIIYMAFFFPIRLEECEFRLYIFRISLTISIMCGVLWQSDSRTWTKLRKVQIAWRGLIYRDTFRDRFRNRRMLARHLYDSTSTFDYSTLRAWAGDARRLFSRSLPSAFCLFNLFFLSREYHRCVFAFPRLHGLVLFTGHNIPKNTMSNAMLVNFYNSLAILVIKFLYTKYTAFSIPFIKLYM